VAFNPDDIAKAVVKCADASVVSLPGNAVGVLVGAEVFQIVSNNAAFYAEVIVEAFKNIPRPPKKEAE